MTFSATMARRSEGHHRPRRQMQKAHRWNMLKHWWLRPHAPYQPVFVIASCRSGSELLLDYLGQYPGVQMLSEVLCRRAHIGPGKSNLGERGAILHIRRSLQTLEAAARGCKLMLTQLDEHRLSLDALNRAFPTAKYVILYRQSIANQFISHRRAIATQQWHVRAGESSKDIRIVIDPARLKRYCERTRRSYQRAIEHPWLAERAALFSYEELAADGQACLAAHVSPLLDAQPLKLQTRLKKQNSARPEDCITNYREVANLLASPLCHQQHVLPRQQQRLRRRAA